MLNFQDFFAVGFQLELEQIRSTSISERHSHLPAFPASGKQVLKNKDVRGGFWQQWCALELKSPVVAHHSSFSNLLDYFLRTQLSVLYPFWLKHLVWFLFSYLDLDSHKSQFTYKMVLCYGA